MPETVSTYDRLLVSVTLEKREGACALFVPKTPDMHMFTNLPSARKTLLVNTLYYYRKRGSASYIMREMRLVRERERDPERERERERDRDGSDVTLVALKLAMNFALFLATNLHLFFCTFPCQKFAP